MSEPSAPRVRRFLGTDLIWSRAALLAVVLAVAVVVPQAWHQLTIRPGFRLVDLEVYRSAGLSILHGRAVYHYVTPAPQFLPFTYPPTSALLAVVLALVPRRPLHVIWTLGEYFMLLVLVLAAFRRGLRHLGPRRAAIAVPLLWAACAYLFPVRSVVRFGQVGLLLALLVCIDILMLRPRWPRGIMVGLATATKLTPGVFIPYLWFTGRRRAALVAAGSFVGYALLTFAALPGTSHDYWVPPHGALFSADRLGDNTNTSNQSLRGLVLRMGLSHLGESVVWIALVAVVAVLGYRNAIRCWRAGDDLAGVAVTGLLAVLLSPVAWIHHLVWIVLVIGVLAGDLSSRRRIATAALVAVVFCLQLPWLGDHAIFRHIGKGAITYQLPGETQDHQLPTSGHAADFPVGTVWLRHPRFGPARVMSDAAFRPQLDACLVARMERVCLERKHPGQPVWFWRLLQSSFCLVAVGFAVGLPPRRRPVEGGHESDVDAFDGALV